MSSQQRSREFAFSCQEQTFKQSVPDRATLMTPQVGIRDRGRRPLNNHMLNVTSHPSHMANESLFSGNNLLFNPKEMGRRSIVVGEKMS